MTCGALGDIPEPSSFIDGNAAETALTKCTFNLNLMFCEIKDISWSRVDYTVQYQ